MVSGLIQLVAKSVEDIILTGEPEVTLFKKVYRRHTNFSTEEKRLRFRSSLNFGSTVRCRVRQYGDFLHKLFLKLTITSPDIRYNKYKRSDVATLLSGYDIDFITGSNIVTQTDINEAEIAITNKQTANLAEISLISSETDDGMVDGIELIYNEYINDATVSNDEFFDLLVRWVMFYDPNYSAAYYFIDGLLDDTTIDTDNYIYTVFDIQEELYNVLLDRVIPVNNNNYNDENIRLLYFIEFEQFFFPSYNYNTLASEQFKNGLSNYYTTEPYTTYDSYKLFDTYLTNNDIELKSSADLEHVRNKLVLSVKYGIVRNLILLDLIYKSLERDFHFIFFKNFKYNSTTERYDGNDSFNSLSLTSRINALNIFHNNYNEYFEIGKLDGESNPSYYKHLDTVKTWILDQHRRNIVYFRDPPTHSFFRIKTLWTGLSPVDFTTIADPLDEDTLINVQLLNLIVPKLGTEINTAVTIVLSSTLLQTTGSSGLHVLSLDGLKEDLFDPLKDAITADTLFTDIVSADRANKLADTKTTFQNSNDDMFVTAVLQRESYCYFEGVAYNRTEYMKRVHVDRVNTFVSRYNTRRSAGLLNTNTSIVSVVRNSLGYSSNSAGFTLTFLSTTDITLFNSSTSNYMIIYSANDATSHCVWFKLTGTSQPTVSATSFIRIDIDSGSTLSSILTDITTKIDALSGFSATKTGDSIIINNSSNGHCRSPDTTFMPYLISNSITSHGSVSTQRVENITFCDASYYNNSGTAHYFTIYTKNNTDIIYVWLDIGTATDPTLPTPYTSSLSISLSSISTGSDIATGVASAINALDGMGATASDNTVTITTSESGVAGPADMNSSTNQYEKLYDAVDMFFTDISKYDYKDYLNNGLNFYQINRSVRISSTNNPFDATTPLTPQRLDVASSVWHYIYTQLINSFNKTYNEFMLSEHFIEDIIGAEGSRIRQYINFNESNNILYPYKIDDDSFDYFRASSDQSTSGSTSYITSLIDPLLTALENYDTNKNILKFKNSSVPLIYQYDSFDRIFDFFTDVIYSSYDSSDQSDATPTTGYEHDPSVIDLASIRSSMSSIYPTPTDIITRVSDVAEIFFDYNNTIGSSFPDFSSFTYIEDTETLELIYDQFITSENSTTRLALLNKMITIVGSSVLTPTALLADASNIVTQYNGFENESDVYNYLLNKISSAGYGARYNNLKQTTKQSTYDTILNTLTERRLILINNNNKFAGDGSTSLIDDITARFQNQNTPAPFAWVEKIGNTLIDEIYLDIGGQIVERHTGELIDIISGMTRPIGQDKGYNIMIGNTSLITSYNATSKSLSLTIPLYFFFCRRYELSLPVVAMHSTYTDIILKIKNLEKLIYSEPDTYYKRKPKITGHISGQYMYLDSEDRDKLIGERLEMLIDPYDFVMDRSISGDDIAQREYIRISPPFKNVCRDIIFTVQDSKYTDGVLAKYEPRTTFNGSVLTTQSTLVSSTKLIPFGYGTESDGSGNPIERLRISFNGKTREKYKEGIYYDLVQQWGHHSRNAGDGIMNYSLSLYPEILQPSGHATLSMIRRVDFDFVLKDSIKGEIISDSRNMIIKFYTHGTTFLRIMSGMAGLAFTR